MKVVVVAVLAGFGVAGCVPDPGYAGAYPSTAPGAYPTAGYAQPGFAPDYGGGYAQPEYAQPIYAQPGYEGGYVAPGYAPAYGGPVVVGGVGIGIGLGERDRFARDRFERERFGRERFEQERRGGGPQGRPGPQERPGPQPGQAGPPPGRFPMQQQQPGPMRPSMQPQQARSPGQQPGNSRFGTSPSSYER